MKENKKLFIEEILKAKEAVQVEKDLRLTSENNYDIGLGEINW